MSEHPLKVTLNWNCVQPNGGAPPRSRTSHSSAVVGNTIVYLFGESAKDEHRTFFNNIGAFETDTRTWYTPSLGDQDLPGQESSLPGRGDHTSTVFGNDIVVFGGRNRTTFFNDVLIATYHPTEMSFAVLEGTGQIPTPRRGHCANNVNNQKLFIFGGQASTGEVYGDTYLFDLGAEKWIRCACSDPHPGASTPQAPPPRAFHASLTDSSQCVILQGGRGPTSVFDDLWLFDPRSEKWMSLESQGPAPGPRLGHSITLFGDQMSNILMWGGCTEDYDEYCNAGYSFDGRNRSWRAVDMSGDVLCPRAFHTANLVGNDLYVFGGWAGHRICTGLWRAVPSASTAPLDAADAIGGSGGSRMDPSTGDPTSPSYNAPTPTTPTGAGTDMHAMARRGALSAGKSRLREHHISYQATPYFSPRDYVPIGRVRVHNPTHIENVLPTATLFPDAFKNESRVPTAAPVLASTTGSLLPPGPTAPTDTISPEDGRLCESMIAMLLSNWKTYDPPYEEVKRLLVLARDAIMADPSLVSVDPPVKIFGDIHGQMGDLMKFFNRCGNPVTDGNNYVFLGDYVDRGYHSVQVVCLLFSLKVRYRQRFCLLRGNHEVASINHRDGFYVECLNRYGEQRGMELWQMFNEVFNHLPPAALVARTVFCIHGGLPEGLNTLNDVYKIARPTIVDDQAPQDRLFHDLLWSDPSSCEDDVQRYSPNDRGAGVLFNRAVVEDFCRANGVKLIVRGHENCSDGFYYFAHRKLVTVFSATNYCGEMNNNGAMLVLDEHISAYLEIIRPGDEAISPEEARIALAPPDLAATPAPRRPSAGRASGPSPGPPPPPQPPTGFSFAAAGAKKK
ncbi:putative Serine/threonine-protein phosphatase BSU1 [Paratrimastix pyriformis]|uniref:Serine/threonine-protein phosphatase n=1 Tax=Paratrimastix pyriformis TaxID=342808 RepID=A0ABQ8UFR1_9EUKA|nr:putative Serine/threonine-protein phosphatase BSU1 [Paratrimastix pyriformis]